jgi:hypothetical protein
MKFQAEMALLLTLLLFFHVVGALAFIPGVVSLLRPHFPLPQKVMGCILLVTFVPTVALYWAGQMNLFSLGVIALAAAIGEHVWARRANIGMKLRT